MTDILSLIALIISIVAIIVFFVMASNISSLNKEMKAIKNYLKIWAHKQHYIVTVKCEKCNHEFEALPEESEIKCPSCTNIIKL